MGERHWYYGDVYCDQNALDLFKKMFGDGLLCFEESSGGSAFRAEPIEMGCYKIDMGWDHTGYPCTIAAWVLWCLRHGFVIDGAWSEFDAIEGPALENYKISNMGPIRRLFKCSLVNGQAPMDWHAVDEPSAYWDNKWRTDPLKEDEAKTV